MTGCDQDIPGAVARMRWDAERTGRRSRTLANSDHLSRLELMYREPYPEDAQRPQRRSDCRGGDRPCPWVSCRYHLYLDVTLAGGLTIGCPDTLPWEVEESCALDVAERGPATLDAVATLLGVSRERSRQLESMALKAMRRRAPRG